MNLYLCLVLILNIFNLYLPRMVCHVPLDFFFLFLMNNPAQVSDIFLANKDFCFGSGCVHVCVYVYPHPPNMKQPLETTTHKVNKALSVVGEPIHPLPNSLNWGNLYSQTCMLGNEVGCVTNN